MLKAPGMRPLFAAPLLALLAPAPAEASGCFLGPYTTTNDPALGCEVVVLSSEYSGPTDFTVITTRGTQTVDLTGTITRSTTEIEVQYTNYACDGGVILDTKTPERYHEFRIALTGAQVGDELTVTGLGGIGVVTASGACTEDRSRVTPFCTGLNSGYPCDDETFDDDDETFDDDEVGCRAGGGGSLAFALLALCGLRRRRSR